MNTGRQLVCLLLLCCSSELHAESPDPLQELAAPCLACHSLEPDGATHVGPSLAGIAGRALAADRNYTYSEAFTERASEGLVWNSDTLDQFLKHPQAMVPGTAMSYRGVVDAAERSLLVDWLLSEDMVTNAAELADANYSRDPAVQRVLETSPDMEYGEYLAGECLTCHQAGDRSGRVPPIHGLTADYFIYALLEYQNGSRSNRAMQNMSGPLGIEEMAALSAVFARRMPE
ncbi:MAG: c-type cytochrome [Granulosicoccus sp.]|nr:c-type cytochrome [Granulosicoccus sp.]